MGNEAKYRAKVLNTNGFTLFMPCVPEKTPILTIPPDPFAQSVTKLFPLGSKIERGEEEWRYMYNGGAALTPGHTIQSPAGVSGHLMDMVTAAAAVGSYEVTVTPVTEAITANQYQDGVLFVNDLAGQGQIYRVKSHPAITHTETGVITLYDPVTTALTSASLTGLRANPYNQVVVTPTDTLTGIIVGVNTMDVTINYYFWGKTKGLAAVECVGTMVLGQNAIAPTATTAGCVGPEGGAGVNPVVGVVANASVTTDHSLIFLTLP